MPIESNILWACVAVGAVGALITGGIGGWIGSKRNSQVLGFLLGFFFGPIGLVIVAIIDQRLGCPHCRAPLDFDTNACRICSEAIAWINGRPLLEREILQTLSAAKTQQDKELEELFEHPDDRTVMPRLQVFSKSSQQSAQGDSPKARKDREIDEWVGGIIGTPAPQQPPDRIGGDLR